MSFENFFSISKDLWGLTAIYSTLALFYYFQLAVCFGTKSLALGCTLFFCHTGTNIGTRYILILICNSALFQWAQRFLEYSTQPLEHRTLNILEPKLIYLLRTSRKSPNPSELLMKSQNKITFGSVSATQFKKNNNPCKPYWIA